MTSRKIASRNSLVVWWLRLHFFAGRGPSLILGWGTKILQAMQQGQKNKDKKKKKTDKKMLRMKVV